MSRSLASRPSALPKPVFVAAYGGIYEHSPWVAEGVWPEVEGGRADGPEALAQAMAAVVDAAPHERKLALIRAHPELAGRTAIGGMAEASRQEQSGAPAQRRLQRPLRLSLHHRGEGARPRRDPGGVRAPPAQRP
jgi:2-oxo-4-hydroxy-4-carboxy--5-ureidoimidazoline (OHCU) decarboxylase